MKDRVYVRVRPAFRSGGGAIFDATPTLSRVARECLSLAEGSPFVEASQLMTNGPPKPVRPDAERGVQPVVSCEVILQRGVVWTGQIAEGDFAYARERGGQHEVREGVRREGEHSASGDHEQEVGHDGSACADDKRRGREEVNLFLPTETRRIDELEA